MKEKQILNEVEIKRALMRLAHEIIEKNKGIENLVFIGIKTRGDIIAKRLVKEIQAIEKISLPVGALDITFYRDDIDGKFPKPSAQQTEISFDIRDKKVILVDDVLYTGRSIRAALDEIIDFGRPKYLQLAVLIDRGHRELPIQADYIGKSIQTSIKEEVVVNLKEIDGNDKVILKANE